MNIQEIFDRIEYRTPGQARDDALSALKELLKLYPDLERLALMPGWGLISKWLVSEDGEPTTLRILAEESGASVADLAWVTNNAYDTPPSVCRSSWKKLIDMGVGRTPTKILFPSCGTGIFALALKLDYPEIYDRCDITAIDIDPVRCQVFQHLNPKASVLCQDFLTWQRSMPDDQFHLVLDNVPFGSNRFDNEPIHVAFLRHMTRLAYKGGAIGYITSTGYTNSAGNMIARQEQLQRSSMIHSVPLPQGVCRKMGTETGVDCYVFIKNRS